MTCSWESKIFVSRGCKQCEAVVQSICTRRSRCHIVFTSQNCCTYAPLHHVVMLEMDCVEQLSVNETWFLALLKPSLGKSALSEVKSVKTPDIKAFFVHANSLLELSVWPRETCYCKFKLYDVLCAFVFVRHIINIVNKYSCIHTYYIYIYI